MEVWERNHHIARIVAGQTRFRLGGESYYVRAPSRLQRCLAEEIFMEQLEEAESVGAYNEEQILDFLSTRKLFTEEDSNTLDVLRKNIEKLKIDLFEKRIRSNEASRIRVLLEKSKSEQERLMILRHSYDHITQVGIASSARQRYLLGCSVFQSDGTPYWEDENGWLEPDPILDKLMFKINSFRLVEADYREIARSEPWHTIWNIQKHCRQELFEGSAVDLTDEQKNLVIWSSVYSSIRDHPDDLDDEVIDDDDMLDGWMLIKKRQRDKNKLQSIANVGNKKIREAAEQFRVVDTVEDARKVMGLNDDVVQHTIAQRMKLIKTKGVVSEVEMPDTITRLRQERQEMFSQHIKGMKGK